MFNISSARAKLVGWSQIAVLPMLFAAVPIQIVTIAMSIWALSDASSALKIAIELRDKQLEISAEQDEISAKQDEALAAVEGLRGEVAALRAMVDADSDGVVNWDDLEAVADGCAVAEAVEGEEGEAIYSGCPAAPGQMIKCSFAIAEDAVSATVSDCEFVAAEPAQGDDQPEGQTESHG